MADLYPVFEVPTVAEEEQGEEYRFPPSSFFDFETGDFVADATGRMRESDGVDAWKQWCLKAVYTQRSAFAAFTDGYGVEGDEAFQENNRLAQQSAIERTISEALTADPYNRTLFVRDFRFSWQDDGVNVTFTVMGQENREAVLTAKL